MFQLLLTVLNQLTPFVRLSSQVDYPSQRRHRRFLVVLPQHYQSFHQRKKQAVARLEQLKEKFQLQI